MRWRAGLWLVVGAVLATPACAAAGTEPGPSGPPVTGPELAAGTAAADETAPAQPAPAQPAPAQPAPADAAVAGPAVACGGGGAFAEAALAGPATPLDALTGDAPGRALQAFIAGPDAAVAGPGFFVADGYRVLARTGEQVLYGLERDGQVDRFITVDAVSDAAAGADGTWKVNTFGSCDLRRADSAARAVRFTADPPTAPEAAAPDDGSPDDAALTVRYETGGCVVGGEVVALPPLERVDVEESPTAVTVTVYLGKPTDHPPGGECLGVGVTGVEVVRLAAPLAGWALLDGGAVPPLPVPVTPGAT